MCYHANLINYLLTWCDTNNLSVVRTPGRIYAKCLYHSLQIRRLFLTTSYHHISSYQTLFQYDTTKQTGKRKKKQIKNKSKTKQKTKTKNTTWYWGHDQKAIIAWEKSCP